MLEVDRGRIIGKWEDGKSTREIAREVNSSVKIVQLWIRTYRTGEVALADHRRFNRDGRKTTPGEDEDLTDFFFNANPFASTSHFADAVDNSICASTVRRRVIEAGINCGVPAKKAPMTEEHKEQRLQNAVCE